MSLGMVFLSLLYLGLTELNSWGCESIISLKFEKYLTITLSKIFLLPSFETPFILKLDHLILSHSSQSECFHLYSMLSLLAFHPEKCLQLERWNDCKTHLNAFPAL